MKAYIVFVPVLCMTLNDYVSVAREKVNGAVRDFGDKYCDGLGDVLTGDVSPAEFIIQR